MKVQITQTIEVEITPKQLAEWFAPMDDEAQADFFIELAKIGRQWDEKAAGSMDYQFWSVGRHLRTCACSTEDARELVRTLHSGMVGPQNI